MSHESKKIALNNRLKLAALSITPLACGRWQEARLFPFYNQQDIRVKIAVPNPEVPGSNPGPATI